jgi:hypothetical protein
MTPGYVEMIATERASAVTARTPVTLGKQSRAGSKATSQEYQHQQGQKQ